jgi:hypothetical protein
MKKTNAKRLTLSRTTLVRVTGSYVTGSVKVSQSCESVCFACPTQSDSGAPTMCYSHCLSHCGVICFKV